jgi:TRAP-type C4-dicarboxylate transport system permease small subunit
LAGQTADKAGVQKTPDLTLLASAVVRALLGLIGIVFFILIIYGGYSWMTAGGNDDKILKAKKLIIRAVIGLAIVASAYSIAYFVTQTIEQTP